MSVFRREGSPFFWCRFMVNGRRYAESTGILADDEPKTMKRAVNFEVDLRAKVKAGRVPRQGKAPTLEEFSKQFITHNEKRVASKALKPRTLECYRYGVKLLKKTSVWKLRLDKINRPTAAELTFTGGASNANQALRTLRATLGYAEELGVIDRAPRIDLREEIGRERIFTSEEEALFLKHASPVLRNILTVMFDCGMRPDEVCRMQWDHIYWSDTRILVQRGKTANGRRHVPLPERMRDTFAEARVRNEKYKRADSPYVFPSPRSKRGHVRELSNLWARTVERVTEELKRKRMKLAPGLVPYSARHTFATNYLKAGGDLGQLSRIMGHSDIRTTMRYVHMLEASDSAQIMDRHNEAKLQIVRKMA